MIGIQSAPQGALQDLGRLSDAEVDALLHDILAAQGNE